VRATCSLHPSQSEHQFHFPIGTRLVRVMGSAKELPQATFVALSTDDLLEMMSLTNLCNRLIVTSTRQILKSQV